MMNNTAIELRVSETSSFDSPLSKRQTEILLLTAEGLTQKQVAEKLHLSSHTVDYHVRKILIALDSPNLINAFAKCVKKNYIAL